VDATCIKLGLGGGEIHPQGKGEDFPQIYGFESYVFYKYFFPYARFTSTISPGVTKHRTARTARGALTGRVTKYRTARALRHETPHRVGKIITAPHRVTKYRQ